MERPHPVLSVGPHYLGLFLVSPLSSQGWPLSFTKLKVIMENVVDKEGKNPWCGHYCLVEGQEDSTTGETVGKTSMLLPTHKTPLSPPSPHLHWALWVDQPETMGRHE